MNPENCGKKIWIGILAAIALALGVYLIVAPTPQEVHLKDMLEQDRLPPLKAFVLDGEWKASAVNLALTLLLLATCRWWLKPTAPTESPSLAKPSSVFWIAMAVVVLFSGFYRLPRLGQSLWNDEEYTLRRYAWGYVQEKEGGGLEFKQNSWQTTLWDDRGANNHVPFSIAARLSLSVWRAMNPDAMPPFSETALRMPAYLAGLATILLAGWMLAVRGQWAAGIIAALVLSLHPWFLRYSVEARGYAFLLLFSLAALHFLERALATLRWRHFLLFGLFQFLSLYSFPGAVYLALALNGIAALILLLRGWKNAFPALSRLIVAGLLSAMVFIQLMGPCIAQIKRYLARDISQGAMGAEWWMDLWSHLTAGVRWTIEDPGNPLVVSGRILLETHPLFKVVAFTVIPVAVMFGLFRVLADRSIPALFVWPAFLALPIAYLHTSLNGNFLFSWYVIYAVPAMAIAIAAAVHGIASLWPSGGVQRAPELVVGIILAAFLTLSTWPSSEALLHTGRQPLREVIAMVHNGESAFQDEKPKMIVASVGTSSAQLRSYDPRLVFLDSRDGKENATAIKTLLKDAATKRVPFRLICGGIDKIRDTQPEVARILDNTKRFSEIDRANGLEEMFSFRVYERAPAAPRKKAPKTEPPEDATDPEIPGPP